MAASSYDTTTPKNLKTYSFILNFSITIITTRLTSKKMLNFKLCYIFLYTFCLFSVSYTITKWDFKIWACLCFLFCGKWLTKSFSTSYEYKIKLETKKQQKNYKKLITIYTTSTPFTFCPPQPSEWVWTEKISTFSTLYPIKEITNKQNR